MSRDWAVISAASVVVFLVLELEKALRRRMVAGGWQPIRGSGLNITLA